MGKKLSLILTIALYLVIIGLTGVSYACFRPIDNTSPYTLILVNLLVALMFCLCFDSNYLAYILIISFILIITTITYQSVAYGLLPLVSVPYLLLMIRRAMANPDYKPLLFIAIIPILLQIFPLSEVTISWCPLKCQSNLKNMGTALDEYKADYGRFPDKIDRLAPKYINKYTFVCEPEYCRKFLEIEPNPRTLPPPYIYQTDSKGLQYTMYCQNYAHHKHMGYKPGYPQYTSRAGIIPR